MVKGVETSFKLILFLASLVLFLNFASATIFCDTSLINQNYTQGTVVQSTINCSNNDVNNSALLSTTGETSYFFLSPTSISANGSATIQITFSASTPIGTHSGVISYNTGASTIPITFTVNSPPIQSGVLVFPTSKIVNLNQGEEKTQNIIVTVPSNFGSNVNIQSVDFNPNVQTIKPGDLNLGLVAPGQSINIPIIFSGKNASVGTYQTQLQIFATNSTGQIQLPSVSLQLQVQAGTTPLTNFSSTQLPTCSITPTEIGLNATGTFTCSLPNPNFDIKTSLDSNYLIGTGTQKTSTQYIYTFKGKNVGLTSFIARFEFLGGQIGELFNQTIKITPSGSAGSTGTTLDFIFYQGGVSKKLNSLGSGDTIVYAIDNLSKSIITSASIYLNGAIISNNTLILQLQKNYEIRAESFGYIPIIVNFNASENQVPFELSKTSYNVGESLVLNSSVDNVSYLLGNTIIFSPYIFTTAGDFVLTAQKQGYTDHQINISVTQGVFITTSTPKLTDTWKKGNTVIANLNQNSTWSVEVIKPTKQKDSAGNTILAYNTIPTIIQQCVASDLSCSKNQITFKINDAGKYTIKASGNVLLVKDVEGAWWSGLAWYWYVGSGAVLVFAVIVALGRKKPSETDEDIVGAG